MIAPEKQAQLKSLGMTLARNVREYFRDANHRKEFEKWYYERYGKHYKWNKVST